MANLGEFAADCHQNSVDHGFWSDTEYILDGANREERDIFTGWIIGQKLALIHSEVSEALEEDRAVGPQKFYYRDTDLKPEGLRYELADTVIRCLDLMVWLGFDVEAVLEEKEAFNRTRPPKHGKNY